MKYILPFQEISLKDLNLVGGKNASLGEMLQHLTSSGVKVPPGFAVTTVGYLYFLEQGNLQQKINNILRRLNPNSITNLRQSSQKIRRLILQTPLPKTLIAEITTAYESFKDQKISLAVRSSATAEDLAEASFAGQQESFLNVKGLPNLLKAIRQVFASLFTARAISYRAKQKIAFDKMAISAGVQRMVRSDKAASGVMFTLDTETGFEKVILITGAYGLGETVVQGLVNPDEFYVFKPSLTTQHQAILSKNLGKKNIKMIFGREGIRKVKIPVAEMQKFCLNDNEIMQLAQYAVAIEKHYAKPMDIEWAKDGITGEIFIVQARPETVKAQQGQFSERYILEKKGKLKTQGRSVGQKIGQGKARVMLNLKGMSRFKKGEVLVTDITDPDWEPIMKLASAIVTNRGGRTCHAAIIARELGIPAVVGCGNATTVIKDAELITVDGTEGEVGKVYEGLLPFKKEQISAQDMPAIPVKLCLNLGNPEQAFNYQSLPNSGIGLARLEFIISNSIGIHPCALLQFKKLPKKLQSQIEQKTAAYPSKKDFYVKKLAEGIATIAAAFYPKEVIFRFSDFKSNEYANLLGGHLFEPTEENPMIGFRGASRYVADSFHDCFALECAAFKYVREQMNLTNAQVMVPFVRTVAEMEKVVAVIEKLGLKRGEHGLKIYMMCEIPANALLAEQFLQYCDGFSIGSNDLTQLTLGLDRDSALISSLFDERNEAVKILLKMAIQACKQSGKYVGICGQAPSDYPDLALWLLEQGIESISLTPDTIVNTWKYLADHRHVKKSATR